MPKSKRNVKVSLTKVKKKPKEAKDNLIQEVRNSAEKYSRAYVVSIENERNAFLKEIRKLVNPGRLICGRNKVMQTALGMSAAEECQEGIHRLSRQLTGKTALLFSNSKPEEIREKLLSYKPSDFARSGAECTETVELDKGFGALAHLPHSIEAHLRQLGLPTQLKDGKVELLGKHTVCKAGDELSSDAAQVLKLLNIKQAKFEMVVEGHWNKQGGHFEDCTVMED